jgi:hypothetical protein
MVVRKTKVVAVEELDVPTRVGAKATSASVVMMSARAADPKVSRISGARPAAAGSQRRRREIRAVTVMDTSWVAGCARRHRTRTRQRDAGRTRAAVGLAW